MNTSQPPRAAFRDATHDHERVPGPTRRGPRRSRPADTNLRADLTAEHLPLHDPARQPERSSRMPWTLTSAICLGCDRCASQSLTRRHPALHLDFARTSTPTTGATRNAVVNAILVKTCRATIGDHLGRQPQQGDGERLVAPDSHRSCSSSMPPPRTTANCPDRRRDRRRSSNADDQQRPPYRRCRTPARGPFDRTGLRHPLDLRFPTDT